MGEKMLFPTSSPLAGRSAPSEEVAIEESFGVSVVVSCRCRLGVKLSGAGGAFLLLSQSASALILRTDLFPLLLLLLFGDGDSLVPLELEATALAGVRSESWSDSGVSSGEEKWLTSGCISPPREESNAEPLESC